MEDEIAEVANKSLWLYKLGPLYQFHEEPLAQKIATLKSQLCSKLELKDVSAGSRSQNRKGKTFKGELLDVRIDPLYFKDVTSYDRDVRPLKFTIEIVKYRDNRQAKHFMFMIPAPRVPENGQAERGDVLPNNGNEHMAYYPLVFIKGSLTIRLEIEQWFEKKYFTYCRRMLIPPNTMIEMVDIWIDSLLDLPSEEDESYHELPKEITAVPLRLEYKTGDKSVSDIDITVSQRDALAVCKAINKKYFWDAFEKHVYTTTGIRTSSLIFERITNSLATIRRDGTIKVSREHRLEAVHHHETYSSDTIFNR
ncbi:hypothetical protein BDF20DRAFT_841030 [Mycotypha africana]|uniref:uncharacterized protein n=1 Tax=Mycotypha africana TaxID=64632 RepID=UPI002300DEAE|nr:uncharacterized protein BDF20DRAFT_841030 [Mycotypha africana]KAI8990819.1 hypothetical protein BDF20DRAFT_841030 [Mycotypha africana]